MAGSIETTTRTIVGQQVYVVKVMTTRVRVDVMWARLLRADGRAFAAALECKPWMLGGRIAATDGGLASVGLHVPPVACGSRA